MQKLIGYALVFVILGMILGFGALILQEVQDEVVSTAGCQETNSSAANYCDNVTAYVVMDNGLSGLNTFGSWLPILAIVIVAGMVISLLLASFYVGGAYFGGGGSGGV